MCQSQMNYKKESKNNMIEQHPGIDIPSFWLQ